VNVAKKKIQNNVKLGGVSTDILRRQKLTQITHPFSKEKNTMMRE